MSNIIRNSIGKINHYHSQTLEKSVIGLRERLKIHKVFQAWSSDIFCLLSVFLSCYGLNFQAFLCHRLEAGVLSTFNGNGSHTNAKLRDKFSEIL